ncbi:hypothetical protein HN51_050320 [Arachis hypogaea]
MPIPSSPPSINLPPPTGTRSSRPMPELQQLLSNLWSATIAWWPLGQSLISFLLSACARGGLVGEKEQVHCKVLVKGYYYNVFVETSWVNFYAVCGSVKKACYVFDEMNQKNVVTWNTMLAGYVRCGDFDGAIRVFDEMPCRNVVSWTTMVTGCACGGKCKQVQGS